MILQDLDWGIEMVTSIKHDHRQMFICNAILSRPYTGVLIGNIMTLILSITFYLTFKICSTIPGATLALHTT